MKKIIFILMLLFSTTVFSQPIDSMKVAEIKQYVTDGKAEKLIDKYLGEFKALVVSIAESLKQPVEHVYDVLIAQQKVQSYSLIIGIITLFALGIILLVITILSYRRENLLYMRAHNIKIYQRNYDLDDGWWIGGVITSLVLIGASIIWGLADANRIITGFINPEYGAIKTIVDAFIDVQH